MFFQILRESFSRVNVLQIKYQTFFTSVSVRLSLPFFFLHYLQSCAHRRGNDPALTDDGSSTVEVPVPVHPHLKQGYFFCNRNFCTVVDTGRQNNSSQENQPLISSIYAVIYTSIIECFGSNPARPAVSHTIPSFNTIAHFHVNK